MKWLVNCINSLYSSDCTSQLASKLPPIDIQELSPVTSVNCKGCHIKPCKHPTVPSNLKIDQFKPLQNTVPPYALHIIIMTGQTNWPSHIEDEGLARTFIDCLYKRKDDIRPFENIYHPAAYCTEKEEQQHQRVIVTNSSLPSVHSTVRNGSDILLLPDNIIISNITSKRVDSLLDYIFGKPCYQAFSIFPYSFSSLILVCGHSTKDKRCGTVGPMLKNALLEAATAEGEQKNAQVALSSHLGGHAFAGNLVVYTHHGLRAIWYGRVTPCYCKEIIENTMEDNKVIQDLVRGVFEVGSRDSFGHCKSKIEW